MPPPLPGTPVDPALAAARTALRMRCRRLAGHVPRLPADELREVARWCEERSLLWDLYGQGAVLETLEREVATRLGKPAAMFLPSGTMAQQIALRLWAEAAGTRRVALPPHSHPLLHEEDAVRALAGLDPLELGSATRVPSAEDLAAIADPLAAFLIELPAREIGGKLPSRAALAELLAAARARGVRAHLDGARVWEAAAGYGCTPAELAAPFDSVYVSFYKGIGGIAGAALAGEADWIDAARVWRRRHGGTLFALLPYAASALLHLEERTARMPSYFQRARELARGFAAIEGVSIDPPELHTSLFHLVLAARPEAVAAARDAVAEARGLWVLNDPRPAVEGDPPGSTRIELTAGDATLAVTVDEAVAALADVMARARGA